MPNEPTIVCSECGETDDKVCDLDWTMGSKRGIITTLTCHECDGVLIDLYWCRGLVVIIDEYEAPLWWETREALKR